MRAPILQGYGGTKPSKQGLSYLSDAGATPEAFGAGIGKALGGLGESLVEAGLKYEERNAKTDRFTALIGESEFKMQTAEKLMELKRSAPANITDFPQQANTLYTQHEQAFIGSLSPRLQREFAMRAQQTKQTVMGDAFQFQYTQQDAFFVEGINTELERAKNGVFQTPDEYAKWDAHMAEVIASSDLPTAEKARLAREVQGALTAVLYGRKVEGTLREAPQVTGSGAQGARQLLYKYENSPDNVWLETHWDTNHWRIGYSSDTITQADGTVRTVRRGDKITKEDAERDLTRRINLAAKDSANKMGLDVWNKLGGPAQAALISVAYNYGSLPASVVTAAQSGDMETLASAVQGLSANKDRRRQEADIIRGTGGITQQAAMDEINADPRFANIPLEDRIAIENGAQTKVNQEIAMATKAATEAANAARNSLFVGLHDGTYDEADIQAGRNSGMLNDIDDIEKAEKILADRKEGISDQAFIAAAVAANGAGYGTGDNERSNKAFEVSGGRQAIAARDNDYFNAGVLPQVQALQDIPTDLVGQLDSMTRSTDAEAMRWAFDRFLDLQDKASEAFDARLPSALADRIDQYRYMRNWAKPEQLEEYMQGGRNSQEVSVNNAMDTQAKAILADPKKDVAKHVADPTELWEKWWRVDETGVSTQTKVEFSKEYENAFIYNYRVTGDETNAMNLTETQMKRRWGPTEIGGRGRQLMRFPLEKVYPSSRVLEGESLGVPNWEAQVRADYGIVEDETFELVSDRQTTQELEAYRAGQLDRLPSYVIYKWTEDGKRIPMDDRWAGDPNAN